MENSTLEGKFHILNITNQNYVNNHISVFLCMHAVCTLVLFFLVVSLSLSLSVLQVIELCRPSDSRLEHVDFECLFSSLSLRLLLRVFASLLLERRVIFTADKLRLAPATCCYMAWQMVFKPKDHILSFQQADGVIAFN